MSYPTNYKEIDRGYVAFGGNPKGWKITGKASKDETSAIIKTFKARIEYLVDHKNTKFDDKANEGFFIGYSLNSKAFRVFNNRTRIVEEILHIRFSENTPNMARNGPNWIFDIDALTKSMNYNPVVVGNQSNGNAGTKACDDVESKSSQDDGLQPSSDHGKKVDEVPSQESECKDQEKEDNMNNTNNVNAAGTNRVNIVGVNTNNELPFDPKMHALEDISTFNFSSDHEDADEEDDKTIQVSLAPTKRIHKDHPLDQVIRDLYLSTQTRNMSKNLEEHRAIGTKWVFRNKKDKRGIVIRNKARLVAQGHTQEEGIAYDEVFSLVARIEAIRLFLAYASFKDFIMYQMDVKYAFIYGKLKKRFSKVKNASTPIETQKPLLKDEDGKEVDVHLYRIFRYLKGQPKFGLWYSKDSPFDLVAYTDSDYAGASLDRKSTTRGCQFLRFQYLIASIGMLNP
nr:putative ribonuclease H-like domain-containing protein [Tanacetum cinerariifolium]